MADPALKQWHQDMTAGGKATSAALVKIMTLQGGSNCRKAMTDGEVQMDMGRTMTEIADTHNEPGTFAAMVGYEWTPNHGGRNNLSCNVIYRGARPRPTACGR